MMYYTRDGRPLTSEEHSAQGELAEADRIVKQTSTKTGHFVSTVFLLGIDHNLTGKGPSVLFETMVKGPDGKWVDDDERRYSTEPEAFIGHLETVTKYGGEA